MKLKESRAQIAKLYIASFRFLNAAEHDLHKSCYFLLVCFPSATLCAAVRSNYTKLFFI